MYYSSQIYCIPIFEASIYNSEHKQLQSQNLLRYLLLPVFFSFDYSSLYFAAIIFSVIQASSSIHAVVTVELC